MPGSYLTLEPGTPVTDRFGQTVGTVKKVLVAYPSFFDGMVVATEAGDRFVDAPEVRRIRRDEVELVVARSDVEHPGPMGPPGPPGVHTIRRDRMEMTEDDRAAAVNQLKIAFIEDRVTLEELERRVELAHKATQLHELDELLHDLA